MPATRGTAFLLSTRRLSTSPGMEVGSLLDIPGIMVGEGFFRIGFFSLIYLLHPKKKNLRFGYFFFWDREDFYIRKNRLSMQSIVWSSFYNHQDDHLDKVSDAFGEFVSLKQQGTHHTGLHGLVGYPLQPTTRRHPGRPLFR